MMQQALQIQQDLHINAHMRRSLQMLSLNSLNIYQEIMRFAEENPALMTADNWENMISLPQVTIPAIPRPNAPSANYLETVAEEQTLQQVLLAQWYTECQDDTELPIGESIISNLDEKGFLKTSISQLCPEQANKEALWTKVLKKIQLLEPVGCAVANCFESLLIQLQTKNLAQDLHAADLKAGLEAWAMHQKHKAMQAFGCTSMQQANHLMNILKDLVPYPGMAYSQAKISYIQPEFKIFYQGEKLIIQSLSNFGKILSIDPLFQSLAQGKDPAGLYAKEQVQQAYFFLKMIQAREETLWHIIQRTAKIQKEFFRHGWTALQPLTQKNIAGQLHLHEATVSRAIRHKYIETAFGLIKMQALFSSKISCENGQASKTGVKEIMKQWLQDKEIKYSDQKICDKLNDLGYKISRRTVTKYRNELEKV